MVRRRAIAGAACVHLAATRAVSNHGGRFGLAAILRDALAIARRRRALTRLRLGLLRMRSEWKDSQARRRQRLYLRHEQTLRGARLEWMAAIDLGLNRDRHQNVGKSGKQDLR